VVGYSRGGVRVFPALDGQGLFPFPRLMVGGVMLQAQHISTTTQASMLRTCDATTEWSCASFTVACSSEFTIPEACGTAQGSSFTIQLGGSSSCHPRNTPRRDGEHCECTTSRARGWRCSTPPSSQQPLLLAAALAPRSSPCSSQQPLDGKDGRPEAAVAAPPRCLRLIKLCSHGRTPAHGPANEACAGQNQLYSGRLARRIKRKSWMIWHHTMLRTAANSALWPRRRIIVSHIACIQG